MRLPPGFPCPSSLSSPCCTPHSGAPALIKCSVSSSLIWSGERQCKHCWQQQPLYLLYKACKRIKHITCLLTATNSVAQSIANSVPLFRRSFSLFCELPLPLAFSFYFPPVETRVILLYCCCLQCLRCWKEPSRVLFINFFTYEYNARPCYLLWWLHVVNMPIECPSWELQQGGPTKHSLSR